MKEMFCMGDDNYIPNVAYVIGLSKNKLYSHIFKDNGVIYVESAKSYKIYKITCDIAECENYVNDEG